MRPVWVLRHVPHETMGTLAGALTSAGLVYRQIDLFEEAPAKLDLQQAAGLVVLGGPMNVDQTDRYPFLATEIDWIRQGIEAGVPSLGICLGSQLMAKALGSPVFRNDVKEIGWYPVELTAEAATDGLFADEKALHAQGRMMVFQWHGDTFHLPHGAVRLARAPQCENQAFRYGASAYALQFHVEMTAQMIDDWLNDAENTRELAELPYIDPQQIREQVCDQLPGMQALASRVFGRFAALCVARTGSLL